MKLNNYKQKENVDYDVDNYLHAFVWAARLIS